MDSTRGLNRIDASQESLERSLARRAKLAQSWPRLPAASAAALLAAMALSCVVGSQVAFAAPSMQGSPLAGARPPKLLYVNPLAHAIVTPERIDQGVDYVGTGWLTAIGWARITLVETTNTGWPGAFIEYQLLHGSKAGRYVYYAEGVTPGRGIYVGRLVAPGRGVARLIPGWSTGIEIGWGAGIGTETLAAKFHQYDYPTRAGRHFSRFIASLGAPPGIP